MNKIILVIGGPGAGKSTACRLVAERFERSIYHEADRVREDVVKGFAAPQMPYSADNLQQFTLGRRASTFVAKLYCDADFAVVVDDTFACHATEGYLDLIADPRTVPIFLSPTKQTMIDRMVRRQGPFDEVLIGLVENGYDAVHAEVDLSKWHVLDNSNLTAVETAEQILELARLNGGR